MDLYTGISLCTGVGMLDHGIDIAIAGRLRPILYVEREAFCCANLAWQMEKGFLAEAPIWSDLNTVTDPECAGLLQGIPVDILFGGIPCQPWSTAGKKRGASDERDLWPGTRRAIAVYEPCLVFIENVSRHATAEHGAKRVAEELEGLGYSVTAGLFSSAEVGASHGRLRCFILADSGQGAISHPETSGRHRAATDAAGASDGVADTKGHKLRSQNTQENAQPRKGKTRAAFDRRGGELADTEKGRRSDDKSKPSIQGQRRKGVERRINTLANPKRPDRRTDATRGGRTAERKDRQREATSGPRNVSEILPHYAPAQNDFAAWATVASVDPARMPSIERTLCGMADGLASRTDRLRAVGNGVDPLVAGYAFVTLSACLGRK